MPKFRICFRVESVESGSIQVEAENAQAASEAFYRGEYDVARLSASLDLEDSEDTITQISFALPHQ